jgi:hypothetical protein
MDKIRLAMVAVLLVVAVGYLKVIEYFVLDEKGITWEQMDVIPFIVTISPSIYLFLNAFVMLFWRSDIHPMD